MWLLLACAAPDSAGLDTAATADWTFPAFEDLPSSADPPPLFTMMATGETVTDVAGWEDRRAPELRRLFAHYMHGDAPADVAVTAREIATYEGRLGGIADIRELDVDLGGVVVQVAIFSPAGVSGAPTWLGLEKCGAHTVTDDPDVRVPSRAQDPTCGDEATEAGRGAHAESWAVADTVARGYAVATFAQADIDSDDEVDSARDGGVRDLFTPEEPEAWGTVAAWSWGLAHIVDALGTQAVVDPARIYLWGHSRRGKAALWAAAQRPGVAAVWAHQSGIMGAALERGSTGETISANLSLFPHWFTPGFADFAGNEDRLPVDQHHLLALLAPRPLLVIDGDTDTWANPPGAQTAVGLATPAWDLYGAAPPSWTLREGGHEVRADDWAIALDYADGL